MSLRVTREAFERAEKMTTKFRGRAYCLAAFSKSKDFIVMEIKGISGNSRDRRKTRRKKISTGLVNLHMRTEKFGRSHENH